MTPTLVAPPQHLLVRLPNPAGDVVASTPALLALRRALPRTRITWAGRKPAVDLVDGLDAADALFEVTGELLEGAKAPLRLGRAWRDMGVDAVLLFPNSWSSALAARASGAGVRMGYARRGRQALLTHAIAPPREDGAIVPEPMRTYYLRLAALLGADGAGERARVVTTTEGEAKARTRLAGAGDGPFLGVSPGAAFGPSKIYPPERLADAVRQVRAETGLVPLVLCGPGEEELGREVVERVGSPVVSTHAPIARWPEAKALLRRCALLLGPDAGTRHVATALGIPAVAIFGPTDPRWSGGDEGSVTVVRREDLDCLGCHLKVCPIGHPCMKGLDPTLVARACVVRVQGHAGEGEAPLASRGVLPGPPPPP